jgi:hypothetical protein
MESWITTFNQERIEFEHPENFSWDIDCIAKSLSQINRYTGHTPWPYSVAQHAVYVSEFLMGATNNPHIAMQGLHHDDPEIVIGDISSPMKAWLGKQTRALKTLEEEIEKVVAKKLGINWPYDPLVDEVDKRIALNEKQVFFPNCPHKWQSEKEGLQPLEGIRITRWDESTAHLVFAAQHAELLRRIKSYDAAS